VTGLRRLARFAAAAQELERLASDVFVPLPATRESALSLAKTFAACSEGQGLSDTESGEYAGRALDELIRRFQIELANELGRLDLFHVTQKRDYDTKMLVQRGERGIDPRLIGLLPRLARNDLRRAARCVAFGLGTAAAFHLFRAMEGVIVHGYFPLLNITMKATQRNLGKHLAKLKEAGVAEEIHQLLDHIRTTYRNPITHPAAQLSIEKALDLRPLVHSVISMMLRDLKERGGQASP